MDMPVAYKKSGSDSLVTKPWKVDAARVTPFACGEEVSGFRGFFGGGPGSHSDRQRWRRRG